MSLATAAAAAASSLLLAASLGSDGRMGMVAWIGLGWMYTILSPDRFKEGRHWWGFFILFYNFFKQILGIALSKTSLATIFLPKTFF